MRFQRRWMLSVAMLLAAGIASYTQESEAEEPETKEATKRARQTKAEPAKDDRTAVLEEIDAAIAKAVDPSVKRALVAMRKCAEAGNPILVLGGSQLTRLPPEIRKLNLTQLAFSGKQLTKLPPEIGKLTKLTTLELNGNPLI